MCVCLWLCGGLILNLSLMSFYVFIYIFIEPVNAVWSLKVLRVETNKLCTFLNLYMICYCVIYNNYKKSSLTCRIKRLLRLLQKAANMVFMSDYISQEQKIHTILCCHLFHYDHEFTTT